MCVPSLSLSHSLCKFAQFNNKIPAGVRVRLTLCCSFRSEISAVGYGNSATRKIPQAPERHRVSRGGEAEGPHSRPHAINVTVLCTPPGCHSYSRISQVICSRRLMAAPVAAAVAAAVADGIAHSFALCYFVSLLSYCLCLCLPPSLPSLVAYFQFTKFLRCMSTFAYFMEYLMNFNFALPAMLSIPF